MLVGGHSSTAAQAYQATQPKQCFFYAFNPLKQSLSEKCRRHEMFIERNCPLILPLEVQVASLRAINISPRQRYRTATGRERDKDSTTRLRVLSKHIPIG